VAQIEWIDTGLRNWGRWVVMNRLPHGNFARVSMELERVDGDGWDADVPIRVDDEEAAKMDRGVATLADYLQRTLVEVYVRERPYSMAARECGVAVPTLKARIEAAHHALSSWYYAESVKAKEKLARDEAAQASVRPV
jgi:DNA-directed RNA polymerase specialized sigma24 family protein